MKNKWVFRLMFLVIIILGWLDYQFFVEGYSNYFSSKQRQLGHILLLSAMMPAGYVGWRQYPALWLRRLWVAAYMIIILFIGTIGAIQWKTGYFSVGFLDNIRALRLFFCSPMPYLILFMLNKMTRDTGDKKR